jgi:ABC-type polar amino acid transport system ATPase subunit
MITLDHVTKQFNGHRDVVALADVSATVDRGDLVAIIGPSGSGKSTLLRLLATLEVPDRGTVTLEDRRPGPGEVGMVFQRFNLFQNMCALDNVMIGLTEVRKLPKAEAREQAMAFLGRVGLADHATKFPEELSGGQQQRVAIARALVMKPKAMLFDEATSALDVELVREVLDVMEALAREGMTMVVVTHEMRFAQHVASSVLMMDDGRIVEEAPPDQFFSAPREERTRRFLALVE